MRNFVERDNVLHFFCSVEERGNSPPIDWQRDPIQTPTHRAEDADLQIMFVCFFAGWKPTDPIDIYFLRNNP